MPEAERFEHFQVLSHSDGSPWELGRGAITVDTTDSSSGEGHPFYYLTQEQVNALGDLDVLRMVDEYDPTWERPQPR